MTPENTGRRADRRSQDSLSLLTEVMTHTLDEDYRQAATDHRRVGVVPVVAVLALFGLLVATAAVQRIRTEPVLQAERAALIERIDTQSTRVEELRGEVQALERTVQDLQQSVLSMSRAGQEVQAQLERLGLVTGTVPATGPGMIVTVDDAPQTGGDGRGQVLDTDLRRLVNGLWVAGAEAIAIDAQRITSATAIRGAGSAITVNFRSLTPPYIVTALGNPDTLPARLVESDAGQAWLDLQANLGIRFDTQTGDDLTVPGRTVTELGYAVPTDVPSTADTGAT